MNTLIYLFAGGAACFIGIAVVALAALVRTFAHREWLRRAAGLLLLIGVCVVAFSAIPLPWWAYALWGLPVCAHLATTRKIETKPTKASRLAVGTLLLASAGLVAMELPHALGQPIRYPDHGVLYVVGDSLSIGADTNEENWPERLGALAGLSVENLSFGGATLSSARSNAERIGDDASLVILELGGNDLLGSTPLPKFEADLRAMLDLVCRNGRDVVMLELPLPPTFNRFGQVQRRLAKEFGVQIVPRRILARVLFTHGATTDGLHFSNQGHALLAEGLWAFQRRLEAGVP